MKHFVMGFFAWLLLGSTAPATVLTYEMTSRFDPCCLAYFLGEAASPLEGKDYQFRFSYDTAGDPLQQYSPAELLYPLSVSDPLGSIERTPDKLVFFGGTADLLYRGSLWFSTPFDLSAPLPLDAFTIFAGGFSVEDTIHGYSGGNEYDAWQAPQLYLIESSFSQSAQLATPEPSTLLLVGSISVLILWLHKVTS